MPQPGRCNGRLVEDNARQMSERLEFRQSRFGDTCFREIHAVHFAECPDHRVWSRMRKQSEYRRVAAHRNGTAQAMNLSYCPELADCRNAEPQRARAEKQQDRRQHFRRQRDPAASARELVGGRWGLDCCIFSHAISLPRKTQPGLRPEPKKGGTRRVGEGQHRAVASPLFKPDGQISCIRLPRKQSAARHAQEVTVGRIKGAASRGVAVGRNTSPLPEAGRDVDSDVASGASDVRGRTD